jgi:hypothetical protein
MEPLIVILVLLGIAWLIPSPISWLSRRGLNREHRKQVQELQQRHRGVIEEHLRNTRKLEDSLHTQMQINARGQQQMMDDQERLRKENETLRIDLGSIVQTARNLGRMALQSQENGDPSVRIKFIETDFTDSFPPRFSMEADPVPRSMGSGVARCPRCGADGD